jgi:hypothetical protein
VTPCAAAFELDDQASNWMATSSMPAMLKRQTKVRGAVSRLQAKAVISGLGLKPAGPPGATCRPISTVSIAIAHAALRATDESLNQKFVHGRLHHYLTNNAASRE